MWLLLLDGANHVRVQKREAAVVKVLPQRYLVLIGPREGGAARRIFTALPSVIATNRLRVRAAAERYRAVVGTAVRVVGNAADVIAAHLI